MRANVELIKWLDAVKPRPVVLSQHLTVVKKRRYLSLSRFILAFVFISICIFGIYNLLFLCDANVTLSFSSPLVFPTFDR